MSEEIVPPEKLWTKHVVKRFENATHWARLSTKRNDKTGETYFDVLIGVKGKKPHAHLGINLDQSLRFSEFRKITHSLKRTVESKKRGLIEDKTVVVNNDVAGGKQLILKLTMDGPTAEVTIDEFRLV